MSKNLTKEDVRCVQDAIGRAAKKFPSLTDESRHEYFIQMVEEYFDNILMPRTKNSVDMYRLNGCQFKLKFAPQKNLINGGFLSVQFDGVKHVDLMDSRKCERRHELYDQVEFYFDIKEMNFRRRTDSWPRKGENMMENIDRKNMYKERIIQELNNYFEEELQPIKNIHCLQIGIAHDSEGEIKNVGIQIIGDGVVGVVI